MRRFQEEDDHDNVQGLFPPAFDPQFDVEAISGISNLGVPPEILAALQGMGNQATAEDPGAMMAAIIKMQQGIMETIESMEDTTEEDSFNPADIFAGMAHLSGGTGQSFGSPNAAYSPEVVHGANFTNDSSKNESETPAYCSPNDFNSGMEVQSGPMEVQSDPGADMVEVNLADLEVPSGGKQNVYCPPHESATKPPPRPQHPTPTQEEPLEFVKLVIRFPRLIFGCIFSFCLVITVALYVKVLSKGNPFSALGKELDLHDIRSVQYDSLRMAVYETAVARNEMRTSSVVPPRQSEVAESTYWVFEAQNEQNVFADPQSIASMKDTFDIFLQDEDFQEYCVLNPEAECTPPLSPLRMYYASSWDSTKVQFVIDDLKDPKNVEKINSLGWCYAYGQNCDKAPANPRQQDIDFVKRLNEDVNNIMASWDMRGDLIADYNQATELAAYLMETDIFKPAVDFGYDKGFSTENLASKYSRGIVFWGSPLEKNKDGTSEKNRRKDVITGSYLDDMNARTEEQSYYFMKILIDDAILGIIVTDAMWAVVSLTLIFVWIRFSTGSFFLACAGFSEILFSITVSWFVFSVGFEIEYFPPQNALAFFIVAAIGADDIFIFFDAYNDSKHEPHILVDLETRMSWVYRKTGTSMFVTSATTSVAFAFSLISPLPSVQSFGLFTAMVICLDYVLVMSLFCTAVVIYHDRFEDRSQYGCCYPCNEIVPSNTTKAMQAWQTSSADEDTKRPFVSHFFQTKVAPFIKSRINAAALAAVFGFWLYIAAQSAVRLETTQQAEQFLGNDHPIQKSFSILNNEFPAAEDDVRLKVFYAWGVGEVDRDGVDLLREPNNYGKPTFEDSFDFSKQCQTDLATFCSTLRNDPAYEDSIKRKNGVGEINCFIEELAAYSVLGNLDDCSYVQSGQWKKEDWQVDPADLPRIMEAFLDEKSCFDENGRQTIGARYSSELGWDGSTMRYAAISAQTEVLTPFGVYPESVTRKEYDQFADIADSLGQTVSRSCQTPVIMSDLDRKFVFMNNQAIYAKTAVQNSIFGVIIAFLVLLLKTRVFHIALFASMTISSVLTSCVGVMVMLGWELGTIESILVGILSGFSIDYIVHLAHEYECSEGDPNKRIAETFGALGTSLFNGALTSMVASLPLIIFCELQFFKKFGIFFLLTISFSWLFANFAFMTLLAQAKIPVERSGWKQLGVLTICTFIGFSIGVRQIYVWTRQQ
ncbi:unnamed protein product [Cylindrotheca closterium]|uniref:SSD domain-containing protein n=1 Tax=Cylindrotheca closterium TaxID=2856 RepID=A0AAD2CH71_9STRA|nr:unnamed protein product [Cylindrotheca closterium]